MDAIIFALAGLGAVTVGATVLILFAKRETEVCIGMKDGVPIYAPRSRAIDRLMRRLSRSR